MRMLYLTRRPQCIMLQTPSPKTPEFKVLRDWSISIGGVGWSIWEISGCKTSDSPLPLSSKLTDPPRSKVENYMTHPLTTKFLFRKIWFNTEDFQEGTTPGGKNVINKTLVQLKVLGVIFHNILLSISYRKIV